MSVQSPKTGGTKGRSMKEKEEQEAVTLEQAAGKLQVSLSTVNRLVKSAKLKTIKVGKRVLVPVVEIEKILGGAK
jgi:excisionase family DNA binding protein